MRALGSILASLAVGSAFGYFLSSCAGTGVHDCIETPGYCTYNEYCDSDTRRCLLTCAEDPPRKCPTDQSCDYATGKCRPICLAGKQATETSCSNGVDDDCNGLTDCADPVCDGKSCGTSCGCDSGRRVELDCTNGKDDDFDGLVDCLDPDCLDVLCRPSVNACDTAERCDGKDAKCPADIACGTGCACNADAGTSAETRCDDLLDNDHDGKIDCADLTDCPAGTGCLVGGDAGVCGAGACQ